MNSVHESTVRAKLHPAKPEHEAHERPACESTRHDRTRIAALERRDKEAVVAMLGRCSAASLYHRFHGFTNGVSHATEASLSAADHDAYGAWSGDCCVGVASLVIDSGASAHIGVLVEDSWQRRGTGSALVAALAGRALERGRPNLVAHVLADDRFIIRLLARVGPITTSFVYGGYMVRVDLEWASTA